MMGKGIGKGSINHCLSEIIIVVILQNNLKFVKDT